MATDWQKKLFKISMVLNVIIMNVFLTINTFTNLGNRSLELTTIYFASFSIVLILSNYALYLYYKKKANQKLRLTWFLFEHVAPVRKKSIRLAVFQ
jgi:hypothetical protein